MIRAFLIAASCAAAFLASPELRAESADDAIARGESLFAAHCGLCHFAGETGTFMLKRRLDAAQPALLAERTDLEKEYVETVVRQGLNSMPWFTRAQLTDAEMKAISAYLARPR